MAANVNKEEENNIEKIACDCCEKDLTYSTSYYICLECTDPFYWCNRCFLKTNIDPPNNRENDVPEPEENSIANTGHYSYTRQHHIHKFKPFKVDIFTPSKTNYQF